MKIIDVGLKFKSMSWGNNPTFLVYHHAEASNCTVQDVHQWHLNNGWSGIGYNYFVRKDGNIYKGRPDNAIGSHCLHHNTNSLGICAEGDYTKEIMPEVQKQALIDLGIYLKNKYNITAIYGHRELYATACPGQNYPLQEIKDAIMKGKINNTFTKLTSFITLDGGGYANYNNTNMAGINLIIKDFSNNIERIFAWVDSDKGASWSFAIVVPNGNYTQLKKGTSKVITQRNGGYTFSKGSTYKVTVKGYDKNGKVIATNTITIKIPQ